MRSVAVASGVPVFLKRSARFENGMEGCEEERTTLVLPLNLVSLGAQRAGKGNFLIDGTAFSFVFLPLGEVSLDY